MQAIEAIPGNRDCLYCRFKKTPLSLTKFRQHARKKTPRGDNESFKPCNK